VPQAKGVFAKNSIDSFGLTADPFSDPSRVNPSKEDRGYRLGLTLTLNPS